MKINVYIDFFNKYFNIIHFSGKEKRRGRIIRQKSEEKTRYAICTVEAG